MVGKAKDELLANGITDEWLNRWCRANSRRTKLELLTSLQNRGFSRFNLNQPLLEVLGKIANTTIQQNADSQSTWSQTIARLLLIISRHSISVRYPHPINEPISATKLSNKLPPNFIHSIDASHMTKVINRLAALVSEEPSFRDLWVVHDCYGTHPCAIPRLLQIVKEEFVAVHRTEFLAINEPVDYEQFKIEEVHDSVFFLN